MSHGSVINETAVQAALVDRLVGLGWRFVQGVTLERQLDDVMVEPDVTAALIQLNPVIAERSERAQDVLTRLRAVLLAVANDGLIATNEEMVAWLCGRKTMQFVDTDDYVPVRLIDFDKPTANELVISTEVTYAPGNEKRRYDIVLWVNGFPIVERDENTRQ